MPDGMYIMYEFQPLNVAVQVVQIIGIVIPLIGIAVLLRKEQSKSTVYLMLANIACVIVNSGYFLTLNSKEVDAAMLAFKIEYLGNILFYFFFLLFLCSYLRFRIPKWFCGIWIAYETFEICSLWNDNRTGMVFHDIEFQHQEKGEFYYLQMEGGLLANVRYGVLSLVLTGIVIYTLIQLIRLRKYSGRFRLGCLLAAESIVLGSLSLMEIGGFSYDMIPICASLAVFTIILGVITGEIFTVTDMGRQWVFVHIEDAVLIVDPAYGYLDANICAEQIFPELKRHAKNRRIPRRIVEVMRKEDDEFWLDEHHYKRTVIELEQNGNLAGYSLILREDTAQYTLMEELVEEKEKAEDANRAKTTFLSNMSHEIRTPMNAIVGMTEILMREDMTEEQKEYLSNIKNSGAALLTIINDILDFSKIESGKLTIVEDNYEPMSMLNDLGMIFLNRIDDKPVELLFDIDKKLPVELYGDSLRLRQIIINIMNNAIKFTETGYVKLTMRVDAAGEGQITLQVSIRDTGQGIREEDIGKLFQSFQQVNTKKNHEKEGTGLGLAISKQLVERMGGSIGVKSTFGEGSEFYFSIPQKVINGEPAAQMKEGNSKEKRPIVCADVLTEYVRDGIKKLAETYGMDFIDYRDAKEKGVRVDYLFMDYDVDPEKKKDVLKNPADANAFCGLLNPMRECTRKGECNTVNKPLYTLNFCRFINHETQSAYVETEEYINFIAPEAQVLIVDDTEMNLKVALGLLGPLQMQIDTAASGKTALEMVSEKRYDLIFMDHMMPDMDGIETVQRMRSLPDEYYRQVPVIALTANAMVGAREKFLAARMNDLVGKPIDMKEMSGKIRKWLPREMIQKQTAAPPREREPEETLPKIEGIDSAAGVKNAGSRELWLSLLGDFYKLIDTKTQKLQNCLKEDDIQNYTIEVHALKNTARMIGALGLSERFLRLEQLGNAGDKDAILAENPGTLELFCSYKVVLKPFAEEENQEKKHAKPEALIEILEQLQMAMDTFDLDTADAALKELESYDMPDACAEMMRRLQEYMADVAMEEVIAIAGEMIAALRTI